MDQGRHAFALESLAFLRGKEDAPVHLQFEKKGKASAKKRWMSPGDDSEVDGGPTGVIGGSDSEQETVGSLKRGEVSPGRSGDDSPHETSPAWHASKDRLKFLNSLSIMPWYQELVELVHGLPKTAPGMGTKIDMPVWATWTWSAQYLPEDIHLNQTSFWKALQKLQSARFSCSLKGFQVVLGFGLLLRECKWAQEVEPDDPAVADLDFLLNSELGVERGEDVMGAVGSVVSRLQQNSGYTKERDRGEGSSGKGASRVEEKMSGSEGGSEEEETPVPRPTNKKKRERSVDLKPEQKVTKGGHHQDVVEGKREQRARKQTKRALGLGGWAIPQPGWLTPHFQEGGPSPSQVGQPHTSRREGGPSPSQVGQPHTSRRVGHPPARLADPTLPGGWAIPQPGWPTPHFQEGGWAIPQPGWPTPHFQEGGPSPSQVGQPHTSRRVGHPPARLANPTLPEGWAIP
ncbi:hypothetical protein EDC04DRAFT_2907292 [Pisolithus marmoratus]|nr:hypothetical protein EDC04DRAFT_2907292 [Pisolithus marmoratus]